MCRAARGGLSAALLAALPTALLLLAPRATAQVLEGELRLMVRDPSGLPVEARIELVSRLPQFRAEARATALGEAILPRLPLGLYRLAVTGEGLATHRETVEIRSALPLSREITLRLAAVREEVTVQAEAPLLDPGQPALALKVGRQQLQEWPGTTLGRSAVDVITALPGWLVEAHAVLHPRGSEYDTQYVIDGLPLYDNRSLGFAPAFESAEFETAQVLTAAFPAEYGRRLGGVIALDSRRTGARRHAGEASYQAGSFGTHLGALAYQLRAARTAVSLGMQGGKTDRYLDPPSLANFTNRASSGGASARVDHDFGARDRVTFSMRSSRTGFLVPNDPQQQESGQRQDRSGAETAGQAHYQHTFSPRVLGAVRGLVRDLTARLWSNPLATPVHVEQDRGFREAALTGSITAETGWHLLKIGGDVRGNWLRESFRFAEPDELPEFDLDFSGRRRGTDWSGYVQDQWRLGNFSAMLGLRVDHYRLLRTDTAASPRAAASYFLPGAGLLLRASFDRVFQPPPQENLLLSSAARELDLEEVEGALDVLAGRANFFEAGLGKQLGSRLRLDVSHYWRAWRNFSDDDVFLNTGLSFPITFRRARIRGTELRLEMPRWRAVSAYVSYSHMLGWAESPVTGGLFIEGGEAEELRELATRFPISQDQRHTLATQLRFEPHPRLWLASRVRYGSGLPVELAEDGDDDGESEQAAAAIPPAILEQVDFARGRVRPNLTLDFSAGLRVLERDNRSLTLQLDVRNAADRLNVINFSGLFSGTALAPGRQMSLRIQTRF